MGTTPGATENRSRKKMASSREIAASPYWTLTAISLQPPVSNCLFIDANFWRETRTCGCKITDASL